jgi:hypothetical protein
MPGVDRQGQTGQEADAIKPKWYPRTALPAVRLSRHRVTRHSMVRRHRTHVLQRERHFGRSYCERRVVYHDVCEHKTGYLSAVQNNLHGKRHSAQRTRPTSSESAPLAFTSLTTATTHAADRNPGTQNVQVEALQ